MTPAGGEGATNSYKIWVRKKKRLFARPRRRWQGIIEVDLQDLASLRVESTPHILCLLQYVIRITGTFEQSVQGRFLVSQVSSPNRMFCICIRENPARISLGLPDILTDGSSDFPQSLQVDTGIVPSADHDCLLTNPYLLTIHDHLTSTLRSTEPLNLKQCR
jgi:hypothetical protein